MTSEESKLRPEAWSVHRILQALCLTPRYSECLGSKIMTAVLQAIRQGSATELKDQADGMIMEILKGGFLILEDDGTIYDHLRAKAAACGTYLHSHATSLREARAFRLPIGPAVSAVLVGKLYDAPVQTRDMKVVLKGQNEGTTEEKSSSRTCTWLQIERSSMVGCYQVYSHSADFLHHMSSKKNIGPLKDSSDYSQKGPRLLLVVSPIVRAEIVETIDCISKPATSESIGTFADLYCRYGGANDCGKVQSTEAARYQKAGKVNAGVAVAALLGLAGSLAARRRG